MRVLDELADALQTARGWRLPRPVRASVRLEEVLGTLVTGDRWAAAAKRLGCPFPPVTFDQGHWLLPDGLETVWDLADHVARHHPDWAPPAARSPEEWREAQILAGVREVLVDAGNLDPDEITRPSRLRKDLNLE
ncbi:MAG TPA: hypothetical protein VH092_12250 [Urbifossiella sp.]|jgi:acyl carrier protein|nr:hypothetical protein [Urbifossiella sp.]